MNYDRQPWISLKNIVFLDEFYLRYEKWTVRGVFRPPPLEYVFPWRHICSHILITLYLTFCRFFVQFILYGKSILFSDSIVYRFDSNSECVTREIYERRKIVFVFLGIKFLYAEWKVFDIKRECFKAMKWWFLLKILCLSFIKGVPDI